MKRILIKMLFGRITSVATRTIGLRLLIILIGFLLPMVSDGQQGQNLSNDFGGSPSAFAGKVIWSGGNNTQYYVAVYDAGAITHINTTGYPQFPQIFGDKITWETNGEIFLYDGSTTVNLSNSPARDARPQIYGNDVVWGSYDGSVNTIYYYDGTSVRQLTNTNSYSYSISAFGIAWVGLVGGNEEIFLYREGAIVQLTRNTTYDRNPSVSEHGVAWQHFDGTDDEIMFYDGSTTAQITDNNVGDVNPRLDGSDIIWLANRNIYYYQNHEITQVTFTSDIEALPKIHNGNIIWSRKYVWGYRTCYGSFGESYTCPIYKFSVQARNRRGVNTTLSLDVQGGWSFYSDFNYSISDNIAVWVQGNNQVYGLQHNIDQTIEFPIFPEKRYGDNPFDIDVNTSAGAFPVFTSTDPSVASVFGRRVTIHKAGVTTISAYQSGSFVLNPAPRVEQTLVIGKRPLYATANSTNIVYGDNITLSISYSGFVSDDNITVIDEPPQAVAAILAKAETKLKTEGTTSATMDEQKEATNHETVPTTGNPKASATFPMVGTYGINVVAGFDDNYEIVPVSGVLTIEPAPLQVQVHDATTEYGEEAQLELSLSYSGFKGSDDEGSLDVRPRTAIIQPVAKEPGAQFLPVGSHVISASGGEDINYSFTYLNGSLNVTKAPLVAKALDATKVYGDANPVFAILYTGLKGTETPSVIDVTPVSASTATTLSPIGTYPIVPGGGMDNNYEIAYEEGVLSVTPAPLTVIADNRSKMYGQEFYMALSISYEGFKGMDDRSVLDVLPTASTSVTKTSDVGTYPIVVAGGADFNYAFTYVDGIFTVNKAILTATADDKTRVYGEANPEFTLTYSGFVDGEGVSVIDMPPSVLYVADELSPPGTYPIYFDGGSDTNYEFNIVPGTLTITDLTRPIPGKPTTTCYLTSPENGATNINYHVTLTSNFVAGANTYTMEVSTRPDFSGTSILKQGKRDIDFLLDYDTRYYVRIQSDQAPGVWSVTSSFTTGNPLTLAYLTSPEDGAMGVPTNVKVTANNLYGAKKYTVELNTLADFTGTSLIATGSARGVGFKKLETGTTYYARVSSDLTPGEWGPVTSFSTRDPGGRSAVWISEEENMETTGIAYTLYPNPFKQKITVLVQTLDQQPLVLTLFDVNGKALETRAERTNDLISVGESVSDGVYLLHLMTPRSRKFIRVIKQR